MSLEEGQPSHEPRCPPYTIEKDLQSHNSFGWEEEPPTAKKRKILAATTRTGGVSWGGWRRRDISGSTVESA
jgi:hypothetical protein